MKRVVAVYVTGGDDYSSIQAMDDGKAIGARGIAEHLLTIDASGTAIGGADAPGVESITVNSDMAKDGVVYLFAYVADARKRFIDTGTDSDVPTEAAFQDDVGIPLSVLGASSRPTTSMQPSMGRQNLRQMKPAMRQRGLESCLEC